MKKIILLPFLLLFFTSLSAQSQIGGELMWECTQSNNYRFTLNVFYDCGRTGGVLDSFILQSTAPGFYNVTLYKVAEIDITEVCKTPSLSTTCSSLQVIEDIGVVKQVTYTSDSTYPIGVALTGVPPTNGYMFHVKIRDNRIPSANITTTHNHRIRAIMYPYNNLSADSCYDNSPVFEEPPRTIILCGNRSSFSCRATDKDSDDLFYDWANPMGNTGTLPYNTQPPLGTWSDLDPLTGIVEDDYVPPSLWTLVYKAKSYRNGVKTAEIYRDYILPKDHINPNGDPEVGCFDINDNQLGWSDTIVAGTSIKLYIKAEQLINIYSGKQVELYSISEHYDSTMNSSGCKRPPCATITPLATHSNPVIATSPASATVLVEWQTNCNHFEDTLYPYHQSNNYQFLFTGKNAECVLAPTFTSKVLSLTIENKPEVPAPSNLTYTYDTLMNTLILNWNQVNDPTASFNHYQVWGATSSNGNFQLLDSIHFFQTTQYQVNLNGITDTLYYFIKTISGCHNSHSTTSQDTIMFDASITGINENRIESNKFTISPNPSSRLFTLHFQEVMEIESIMIFNDQGQLVKSISDQNTSQGNSISIDLRDQKAGKYFVTLIDSSGRKYNSVLLLVR